MAIIASPIEDDRDTPQRDLFAQVRQVNRRREGYTKLLRAGVQLSLERLDVWVRVSMKDDVQPMLGQRDGYTNRKGSQVRRMPSAAQQPRGGRPGAEVAKHDPRRQRTTMSIGAYERSRCSTPVRKA